MQIKYINTLDDLVAFNIYHHRHSEVLKRSRIDSLIYMSVTLVSLTVLFFVLTREIPVLICGTGFTAIYIYLCQSNYRKNIAKFARRQYCERGMNTYLGERILDITEEGIQEKTDLMERKDKWTGVQGIVVGKDMAFIYIQPLQAHIIPRGRVAEGDFDLFVATAQRFWRDNQAGSAGA